MTEQTIDHLLSLDEILFVGRQQLAARRVAQGEERERNLATRRAKLAEEWLAASSPVINRWPALEPYISLPDFDDQNTSEPSRDCDLRLSVPGCAPMVVNVEFDRHENRWRLGAGKPVICPHFYLDWDNETHVVVDVRQGDRFSVDEMPVALAYSSAERLDAYNELKREGQRRIQARADRLAAPTTEQAKVPTAAERTLDLLTQLVSIAQSEMQSYEE